MNNFFDFITNDIEAKKTLLSSMPINNKTNIKKYNEKIASIYENYEYYKKSVLNYLKAKSESFQVEKNDIDKEEAIKKYEELKKIKYMLNTMNSYKEKLGLDDLLYDIKNYSNFTFEEINKIIEKLLEKFRMVGIELKASDFKYTCYVNEYMEAYFCDNNDYEKLSEIFEKIYWYNPNIIEHIELNFRKLIKKHEKTFEEYVKKEQHTMLTKNQYKNYEEFTKDLKQKYIDLEEEETIYDIIEMAKNSEIEINNYFEDNKFRKTTYETLTLKPVDFKNEAETKKLLDTLERLKNNVKEYGNYIKFKPLFTYFKEKYEKQDSKESILASLKTIDSQISTKESKLESINNKIFNCDKPSFPFMKKENAEGVKAQKIESLKIAKELYDLYYEQEKTQFENKIITLKDEELLLISDVVRLYYSFNFHKKEVFKEIFNLTSYDEVIKLAQEFDEFASTPTNIIINGINTFEESDIASVIANKYKLENVNIEPNELDEDNLPVITNKIDFVKRINKIENSSTSIEKIWFIVQVEKILEKENKE